MNRTMIRLIGGLALVVVTATGASSAWAARLNAPTSAITAATAIDESTRLYTSAPRTDASARLEPTDRSMPRVRITICCPMATMAITAVWASTFPTLRQVRTTGTIRLRATQRTIRFRIRNGPARSTSSETDNARSPLF